MKVGVALMFEDLGDWERSLTRPNDPPAVSDTEFWRTELAVGDLVEPLGFDSLWTAEHHFTSYCLEPNPLQLLSYFAGRTERIDLGSCVVVLPWHHPLRVAEQITMLDNFLGDGRELIVGFGRGAAAPEFKGLGVDMADTRALFSESVEIIQRALTQERFSYSGEKYQVPELSIRPRPRDPEVASRLLCSWMSPQSLEGAARLGLGMFFTTQKDPLEYEPEIVRFNEIRSEEGREPLQPYIFLCVYCGESEEEAWQMARRHIGSWQEMSMVHYGLDDAAHFEKTGVYDWWAEQARGMAQTPRDIVRDGYVRTQVWGTPEQCTQKIRRVQEALDPSHLVLVFHHAGMTYEQTKASMELFSREVLPAVRESAATKVS